MLFRQSNLIEFGFKPLIVGYKTRELKLRYPVTYQVTLDEWL